MATLYVTEGRIAAAGSLGPIEVMAMPAILTGNNVTISGSSVQSAAFNISTQVVRVEADAVCSVKIGGTNPTATAADMRIAANAPGEYFAVNPGDKLAVITNS